tara:strand:+ start:327 stop:656 length:330 start_codon:yes stop_codon:yes gene_type:complete
MSWYNLLKNDGTCYPDAYNWMIENEYNHGDSGAMLAHATVTGTGGGVEGVEYGHAFILINNSFVIDVTTGTGFPKDEYYRVGKVKDVKLYTLDEMLRASLSSGHYGPWH